MKESTRKKIDAWNSIEWGEEKAILSCGCEMILSAAIDWAVGDKIKLFPCDCKNPGTREIKELKN